MSHNQAPQARLTTVAKFPAKYFLENLAVRKDNSVLVTAMNHKELWYVPPQKEDEEVEAVCMHTFEQPTTGIVEVEPEEFVLLTGNLYTTHESYAHRLDLRQWEQGSQIEPRLLCRFPESARGLNGCCLIAQGVALWLRTASRVLSGGSTLHQVTRLPKSAFGLNTTAWDIFREK